MPKPTIELAPTRHLRSLEEVLEDAVAGGLHACLAEEGTRAVRVANGRDMYVFCSRALGKKFAEERAFEFSEDHRVFYKKVKVT